MKPGTISLASLILLSLSHGSARAGNVNWTAVSGDCQAAQRSSRSSARRKAEARASVPPPLPDEAEASDEEMTEPPQEEEHDDAPGLTTITRFQPPHSDTDSDTDGSQPSDTSGEEEATPKKGEVTQYIQRLREEEEEKRNQEEVP